MWIDAHMHFWNLTRQNYAWIKPDLGKVQRNYLPEDLAPLLAASGVEKTIVVESINTREETKFLLRLFEWNPQIAGVIGGIALDSNSFENDLEEFRGNKGLVGVRIRSGWKSREWESQPQVKSNLTLLEQEGVPIDLTAGFHETEAMLALFQAFPELKVAIDPAGDPAILRRVEFRNNWKKRLSEVASAGSVMCKIKPFGLIDLTRKENRVNTDWNPEDLNLFVEDVLEAFGSHHVIFGTNWPVSLVAAEYGEIIALIRNSLPSFVSNREIEAIFGLNALRHYHLHDQ